MMGDCQPLFLSPDERYDVWEVKRAERPHLLLYDPKVEECVVSHASGEVDEDEDANNDEKKEELSDVKHGRSDDKTGEDLPLMDGCDIAGWRKQGIIILSTSSTRADDTTSAALNVGPGCVLLRRHSQLPIISSRRQRKWKDLQSFFFTEPIQSRRAHKIQSDVARALPPSPWFERQNIPVILEGLTSEWNAMQTCKWDSLVQRYGHCSWRFSDTHGVCMSLFTYHKYATSLEGLADDAPLAVYDSQLIDDYNNRDDDGIDRQSLWTDYKAPKCFSIDLFECLDPQKIISDENVKDEEESAAGNDESNSESLSDIDINNDTDDENSTKIHRPPYRWILMGPTRSGTGLHVDPLGTHAWVSIVEGMKRWVLFPPTVDKTKIGMQEPQIPSVIWFQEWYPDVIKLYGDVAVEVLQRPGETVYVPAGWPHLVLNLEQTVAITENYATEFPTWKRLTDSVQQEEPEMFSIWLELLQDQRSDLVP